MSSTPATDPLQRVHDWLWRPRQHSRLREGVMRVARYAFALVRDLVKGDINLRAMSLVYTTLLSLVPLLALSFSMLKAFGVHNQLEPLLAQLLAPLGPQAGQITENIIGFVDNMKVGVLGAIGVATLLYTSVSMISKIEDSFNYIWKIDDPRAFAQRFGQYLTVLIVGPVVMFAALGLTASVRSSSVVTGLAQIEPFGTALLVITEVAPYALIVGAFTFMYAFIPNTRVRIGPAAAGGLFAGIAWQSASVAFAKFVAGPTSSYGAIYAGFAIVIVLLIWLYTGWLHVLFGCRLAFYVQNPRFLAGTPPPAPPASRDAEFLALRLMELVAGAFIAGHPPLKVDEVQRALAAPAEHLRQLITRFTLAGVLVETPLKTGSTLLPARDPSTLSLAELWTVARGPEPAASNAGAIDRRAWQQVCALEQDGLERAGAQNLRDWLADPQAKP